jgi:uroporphyrinogen-III synthase
VTRVAVTTAADRQDRVAGLMRAVGVEPVSLPCIEIQPADAPLLDAARRAAASADAIVLTSTRTVRLLWPEGMPPTPVWAVGSATASAVERAGGRVAGVGTAGAAAIVRRIPHMPAAIVSFPHAAGTDDSVANLLAAKVGTLHDTVVYSAVPLGPASTPVDAVAFMSPSAVAGWFQTRGVDGLIVGAIGPTTADALLQRDVTADVVPPAPDVVVLAHGIAAASADRIPSEQP